MNRLYVLFIALLCASFALVAQGQGFIEIPSVKSTQAGIGLVSGWHCSANRIEISIDGGPPMLAGSHTSREDTRGFCGRADTGFSLLWNWSLLPTNCFGCRNHRVTAFADGVRFAEVAFEVENFGTEFLTGKAAQYALPNFPEIGSMTWVRWEEEKQNFSVYLTAKQQLSVTGKYYGALQSGAQNPICGPFPPTRVLPITYGNFTFTQTGGNASLKAEYVTGAVCQLPTVALQPYDRDHDDGYLMAIFDASSTASCPEFPGGLTVRANGQRLIADSGDNCVTAHIVGAK
jgi:hypothetical protein